MASISIAFAPESSLLAVVSLGGIAVVSFSPSSSLSGSLELLVPRTVAISASPVSSLVGTVALIVAKKVAVEASPSSSLAGRISMIVPRTVAVAASPVSSLVGEFSPILSKSLSIAANPVSSLRGSVSLSGFPGVTFCQVVDEILNAWGIEGVCNAPDFALARAVNDVNGAMQTIWNQAADRNYWTNSTLTFTFADGEDSKSLPDNIQNVIGPCRRSDNRRPLAIVGTLGELDTFSDLYMDGETSAEPLAYHIDRVAQTGNDPAKATLRVTPAVVGASVDLLLDVVTEAPRYAVSDLDECPVIPIPHRYVESLLLPIAKYKASSFFLFNNAESKPTIDRDYEIAMKAIGAADPLPGKSGDNKEATGKQ